MLHAERVALQGIFELDSAEDRFIEVMESKTPQLLLQGYVSYFATWARGVIQFWLV